MDGIGLLSDRLRYYRTERSIVLATETQSRLGKRGIEHPRIVPPKIAIPLIEAATIENEPELSDLWAELLTSAMDPNSPAVEKKHVSILQELTSEDAKVLKGICADWVEDVEPGRSLRWKPGSSVYFDDSVSGTPHRSYQVLFNLARVGLIEPAELSLPMPNPKQRRDHAEHVRVPGNLSNVVLTPLGTRFCGVIGLLEARYAD